MFMPIVAQKFENSGEMNADPKWFTKKAETDTERLLFDITKQRPWRFNAALKKASIDKSPLALAFSKCKKRAADEETEPEESCGAKKKK
jgi:hypothetical protein